MELNLTNLSASDIPAEEKETRVLILGSGPAGWSAALYAARAEMEPVLLTGVEIGGQAALTHTIENYPGFPDGVGGMQLGELFQRQAERFGTQTVYDRAAVIDLSERPFIVRSDSGTVYKAQTLIIATGASPNHLQVPGEVRLTGKGVSYCGTCDGFFSRTGKSSWLAAGTARLRKASS